jgi:hypothetical protein
MKAALLAVVAILLVAGCATQPAPPASPEPNISIPVTPAPNVSENKTPEAPGPSTYYHPESNACLESLEDPKTHTAQGVQPVYNCFFQSEQFVECSYFLLKYARAEETATDRVTPYAIALYGKALDCSKKAESLPQAGLLPANMTKTIEGYYNFYQFEYPSTVKVSDIDALVLSINATRKYFR